MDIDKTSALYAKNILPSIEVYGMMELNLQLQTDIIGVIAKTKRGSKIGKVREEL